MSLSLESLEDSLALHRRFLALVRVSRSEEELLQIAVEALAEHLPGHRISYSVISSAGDSHLKFSHAPPTMRPIGKEPFSLLGAPEFLAAIRRSEVIAIEDSQRDPRAIALHASVPCIAQGQARLHVPFAEEGGEIGLFSIVYPEPKAWDPALITSVREVGELVHLLCRDARSRARLEHSELIFRQFADHVDAVFWMTDPRTQDVIYVSPAYERVWGRSIASLYENPLSYLEGMLPEYLPLMQRSINEHGQGPAVKEYRLRRPDGSLVWVKDSSYPVFDSNGGLHRVVGIAQDVTALKEAEARVESSRAQLLASAKLAALGELASGIAHEINNPLAVIHGLTLQMIEVQERGSKSDPVLLNNLRTMEKMANRIAGITRGLRTFSRQSEADPLASVDLAAIVEETISLCDAKIRAAGARLCRELPPGPWRMHCRPAEIARILVNLINNAVDAVQECERREITVRVVADGGRVQLTVSDTGLGVPDSLRSRIFEPFFTTKEAGHGTGLGLSISRNLAEGNRGSLTLVESDTGAKFMLEFPLEDA